MSYKRTLVRLIDRPGGRFLLGGVATLAARWITHTDVRIAYLQGRWTRRLGASLTSCGPEYCYTYREIRRWRDEAEEHASETRDYWLRFYEPAEGDTIIDVGAGHGEDTFTFSRAVGKSGRVIAIEAHPLAFRALKRFCRVKRLSNVTPVHLALMDKPGEVHLVESECWMENRVEPTNGSSGVAVPAGTLDDLCRKESITDISFLKMNIEGAERFALLGAESAMHRVGHICVACHDFRSDHGHGEQFRTRAFVEQFLLNHGFTTQRRADDPRPAVPDHVFGLRLRQ